MFKELTACAGILTAAALGMAAQAAVVLTPNDTDDLEVGDIFSVTVSTDESQTTFDSFQFDLTYDAGVIGYTGGTFGSGFPPLFANAQSEPSDAAGETTVSNVAAALFMETLSGAQTLITLEFVVRSTGSTDIALSPTAGVLLALTGNPVGDGAVSPLTISIAEDQGDVVPLPAAALLFAPAAAFLARRHLAA